MGGENAMSGSYQPVIYMTVYKYFRFLLPQNIALQIEDTII